MVGCFSAKKDGEAEKEAAVMRNGRMFLENSIAINNGSGNPIRTFSIKDLNTATNNFADSQVLWVERFYKLYNGCLQNRPIILKKHAKQETTENHFSEIVFASQMSSHNNVLKLLGCCLESELPILVFESAENGTLHDRIYNSRTAGFQPLLWKDRLKIATGVASAIAYLHTAFSRPIIHRDVRPPNILLDQNYLPKLTDFYTATTIPEGDTHVKHQLPSDYRPVSAVGFLAPEHFSKNLINEKVDVYSFGVILVSLLTGKTAQDPFPSATPENYSMLEGLKANIEGNSFNYEVVVDPLILEERSWPGKEQQLQNLAVLAVQCTCDIEDNRPTITEVAKELRQMYQSFLSHH